MENWDDIILLNFDFLIYVWCVCMRVYCVSCLENRQSYIYNSSINPFDAMITSNPEEIKTKIHLFKSIYGWNKSEA